MCIVLFRPDLGLFRNKTSNRIFDLSFLLVIQSIPHMLVSTQTFSCAQLIMIALNESPK